MKKVTFPKNRPVEPPFDRQSLARSKDGRDVATGDELGLVGTIVDNRYAVKAVIGSGAYGTVYEAEHVGVNRPVALKVLHHHDPTRRERFRREAEALSKITHPNVVALHDYGVLPNGQSFLVMDLIDGEGIDEYLKRKGRLLPEDAIKIAIEVCHGLTAAHNANLVHRDLKPNNIVLTTGENGVITAKVIDFGLAKPVAEDRESLLTATGETIGTPEYMSPEQCTANPLDGRSDIYSLGCILYELLVCERAFEAPSIFECMQKQVCSSIPKIPPQLNLPDELCAAVYKCLAKDPADRYQTAKELEAALNTVRLEKRTAALSHKVVHLASFATRSFAVASLIALSVVAAPVVNDAFWPAPFIIHPANLTWRERHLGNISFLMPAHVKVAYTGNFNPVLDLGILTQHYTLDSHDRHYLEVKEYPEMTLDKVIESGKKAHAAYADFVPVVQMKPARIGKEKIPAIEHSFFYKKKSIFERHFYFEMNKTVYKVKEYSAPQNEGVDKVFAAVLDSVKAK